MISDAVQSVWAASVFEAQLPVEHLTAPAPWAGHIPFAFWSVHALKPRVFVELGSYSGVSYFAFCQAIRAFGTETKAHAIDTWDGDPHAGFYGDNIYQAFSAGHAGFASFSTMHRQTFDAALDSFADQSIDFLHIDGLHTYEAVQHDFNTWLPKLTDDAVVLFHDIREYSGDFGVHQFWDELMLQYQGLAFEHSHGLGVLCLSVDAVNRFKVQGVEMTDSRCSKSLSEVFAFLGRPFELQAEVLRADALLEDCEARDAHHHRVAIALKDVELLRDNLLAEIEQLKKWSLLPQVRFIKRCLLSLWTKIDRYVVTECRKSRRLVKYGLARILNALGYLLRGDLDGLRARFGQVCRDGLKPGPRRIERIGLLTVPHTLSVAYAFQEALGRLGFAVTRPVTTYRKSDADVWFVFGAQVIHRLPPAGRRILVQLEQTSSDRWFTPRYIRSLKQSIAVCDFSQKNLAGLHRFGVVFPHVFLTRLAGFSVPRVNEQDKDIDVLFYGDPYCDRRQQILRRLHSEFDVQIVTNTFGEAMHALIQRSKVVVNIHYYPEANLETTRLYECLSLGARVVSETSADSLDYPALQCVVDFVPADDSEALLDAVRRALGDQSKCSDECQALIASSQVQLQWDLARLFLGIGMREPRISELLHYALQSDRIVLTLPETPDRYLRAVDEFPNRFQVISGLRATPGWLGCGFSYQAIALAALTAGFERIWIIEDDAELPRDTEKYFSQIETFLDGYPDWDVFCGLISRFEYPPEIVDVIQNGDLTFVVLDQMMSMVANCYSKNALQGLSEWNGADVDSDHNTIDVYLNQHVQRVVTTIPALFGHQSSLASTLWGIGNKSYEPVIDSAQEILKRAVSEFLAQRDVSEVSQ